MRPNLNPKRPPCESKPDTTNEAATTVAKVGDVGAKVTATTKNTCLVADRQAVVLRFGQCGSGLHTPWVQDELR